MHSLLTCAACGTGSASDGGPLIMCSLCECMAYCSPEHQAFDWKRHKPLCMTVKDSRDREEQRRNSLDGMGAPSTSGSSGSSGPSGMLRNLRAQMQVMEPNIQNNGIRPPPVSYSQMAAATFNYNDLIAAGLFQIPTNGVSIPTNPPLFPSPPSGLPAPLAVRGNPLFPLDELVRNITANNVNPFASLNNTPSGSIDSPLSNRRPIHLVPSTPTKPVVPVPEQPSTSSASAPIQATEDPDIQIIEDAPCSSNSVRSRKRPTPTPDKIPFIDHSRNFCYGTTLQEHQKHLLNRGLVMNTHQSMVMRLRYIAEHAIRSLNEFGWAVVDNFLGATQCQYTAREIERLQERGLFTAGQVVDKQHMGNDHIREIRSDQIYWFDGADRRAEDAATVRLLVTMIDSVILHFNKRIPPYAIGGRSRAMLAIYPGNGTRYIKHVDNPAKDGRCITAIYYCNKDWDVKNDGGSLRLYPESSEVPMDIDPRADRLVFFWSDRRMPHEVMPVYRNRFAITIWYMDQNERRLAVERLSQAKARDAESSGEDGFENKRAQTGQTLSPPKVEPVELFTPIRNPYQPIITNPVPIRCQSTILETKPESDIPDSGVEDGAESAVSAPILTTQQYTPGVAFSVDRESQRLDDHVSVGSDEDEVQLPPAPEMHPEYNI